MPRRSAADKEKTHQQIVRRASQQFRSRGSAVGIGEMMKDLGLTQGGFYRHFGSKEDLFVEALEMSFREVGDRLEQTAERAEPGQKVSAIIEDYLSADHLKHPEIWCALASLAPEVGRLPAAVRKRVDAATMLYMERMSKYLPGANPQEKRHTFLLLFSGMAGAIAVIRSLGNPNMQEVALKLARTHYLKTFAADPSHDQNIVTSRTRSS